MKNYTISLLNTISMMKESEKPCCIIVNYSTKTQMNITGDLSPKEKVLSF
jgi:hypothetical protein